MNEDPAFLSRLIFLRMYNEFSVNDLSRIKLSYQDLENDNAFNTINKLFLENLDLHEKENIRNTVKKKYYFTASEVIQSLIKENHFTKNQIKFLKVLAKSNNGKVERDKLINEIGIKGEFRKNRYINLKSLKNTIIEKLKEYRREKIIIIAHIGKPAGYKMMIFPLKNDHYDIEIIKSGSKNYPSKR